MKNLFLKLLFISLGFTACDLSDTPDDLLSDIIDNDVIVDKETDCDFNSEISADDFNNASSEGLTINEINIQDDCLKINFWAGGCDGETWEMHLIDSSAILESFPVQRNSKIDFVNDELCEKAILREYTFDISNLQIENNERIILNIIDNESSINYDY